MRKGLVAVALCFALVAAACGSTQTAQKAAPPTVGWVNSSAQAFDGAPPAFNAINACGSSTDTYLAELLHKPPTDVKVLYEWGDTVPGGKQLLVSGNVATVHLGPGDLPVDHPFGPDLSMDVNLDHGANYGDTLTWVDTNKPKLLPDAVEIQVDLDTEKFYKMFVELMTAPTPPSQADRKP